MVPTTFIDVCGKFQYNMSKVTTVMTARGMMGHTDLDDKIRLCVNFPFDSLKYCLTHHSSQVHSLRLTYGVKISQTTRQKMYLLYLKILHCCVLLFLKYR